MIKNRYEEVMARTQLPSDKFQLGHIIKKCFDELHERLHRGDKEFAIQFEDMVTHVPIYTLGLPHEMNAVLKIDFIAMCFKASQGVS
jgi:hypothetical protein